MPYSVEKLLYTHFTVYSLHILKYLGQTEIPLPWSCYKLSWTLCHRSVFMTEERSQQHYTTALLIITSPYMVRCIMLWITCPQFLYEAYMPLVYDFSPDVAIGSADAVHYRCGVLRVVLWEYAVGEQNQLLLWWQWTRSNTK